MEEQPKNRKTLIRALIQLVICVAVLLLCLPIKDALVPLRQAIWLPMGKQVGSVVLGIAFFAAAGGAIHALRILTRLLNEKLHMPLNWGRLTYGLGLLAFGVVSLISSDSIAFLFGLVLTSLGAYVCYRVIHETRTSMTLDRDGETVVAEIYNITHSSISVNDAYTYTVCCRADGRIFTKKTTRPMDMSLIGKKVYVRISAGSPDVYDVDLDNIIVYESEKGLPPEETKKAPPLPSVDTSAYIWRWDKPGAAGTTTAAAREEATAEPIRQEIPQDTAAAPVEERPPEPPKPEEKPAPVKKREEEKPAQPYVPLTWGCTKSFLRFPVGACICFAVFFLLGIFFSSMVMNRKGTVFFVFLLPGLIALLIVLGNMRRKARLYRYGRQVRAKISTSKFLMRYDGDPLYKVVCHDDTEFFSGKLRMPLQDPHLVGKWVTVFVSERNPDRYLIEGQTVSETP